MAKYFNTYLKANGYATCDRDIIPCEVCGMTPCVIHHIIYKSQGGKDVDNNLIALCRKDHSLAHDSKITKTKLFKLAQRRIDARNRI